MAPVAVALAGERLGRETVAFIGWFGPRGLASVVFALIALEELGQHVAGPAVAVMVVTVLFSVIAHGATADPLARRYGPQLTAAAPSAEDAVLPPLPERRLIRRAS
jgi:NhaP-type Na+/H+ or K+/H+ antiporter